jgi:hypothetical protein
MNESPDSQLDETPEQQDARLRRQLAALAIGLVVFVVVGLFSIRQRMIFRHEVEWPVTSGSNLRSVPADAEATVEMPLSIRLVGPRPGLFTSLREHSVKGTWYGTRWNARRVRASDYHAILQFADRGPGHWTLPVLVTGPDSKHVIVEPDSIRVVLH